MLMLALDPRELNVCDIMIYRHHLEPAEHDVG